MPVVRKAIHADKVCIERVICDAYSPWLPHIAPVAMAAVRDTSIKHITTY